MECKSCTDVLYVVCCVLNVAFTNICCGSSTLTSVALAIYVCVLCVLRVFIVFFWTRLALYRMMMNVYLMSYCTLSVAQWHLHTHTLHILHTHNTFTDPTSSIALSTLSKYIAFSSSHTKPNSSKRVE